MNFNDMFLMNCTTCNQRNFSTLKVKWQTTTCLVSGSDSWLKLSKFGRIYFIQFFEKQYQNTDIVLSLVFGTLLLATFLSKSLLFVNILNEYYIPYVQVCVKIVTETFQCISIIIKDQQHLGMSENFLIVRFLRTLFIAFFIFVTYVMTCIHIIFSLRNCHWHVMLVDQLL